MNERGFLLSFVLFSTSIFLYAMEAKLCNNEFHQFEKQDMTAILSSSNPAVILAYLCHTLTKEEAVKRVQKILATDPALIAKRDAQKVVDICAKYDEHIRWQHEEAKKAVVMHECFVHCWPRNGDGEPSGCRFFVPTALEILKKKIDHGCSSESCQYVYEAFNEFQETQERKRQERRMQREQEVKQHMENEYHKVVEDFMQGKI